MNPAQRVRYFRLAQLKQRSARKDAPLRSIMTELEDAQMLLAAEAGSIRPDEVKRAIQLKTDTAYMRARDHNIREGVRLAEQLNEKTSIPCTTPKNPDC
jgi:hypothetical protein